MKSAHRAMAYTVLAQRRAGEKKLSYRCWTAWCAMSVEILSDAT